jgi:hypothetical protein
MPGPLDRDDNSIEGCSKLKLSQGDRGPKRWQDARHPGIARTGGPSFQILWGIGIYHLIERSYGSIGVQLLNLVA